MADTSLDTVLAKLEALTTTVASVGADAREARDATIELKAKVDGSDTSARLSAIEQKVATGFQDARSDLVNSMDKLTRETRENHNGLEGRVASLEAWRQRIEGANSLLGWLSKNAPWLITGAIAVLALLKGRPQ